MNAKPILAVRNVAQQVLFVRELSGQLSDGHWENARPSDHWEPWCEADVVVDAANVGRSFHVRRDAYNLTDNDLLDVVGERMIAYVRLAFAFGVEQVELLSEVLDIEGIYRGIPTYTGASYDKVRAQFAAMIESKPNLLKEIETAVENEALYGKKQLRADLKDLKGIMKTMRRSAPPAPSVEFSLDTDQS